MLNDEAVAINKPEKATESLFIPDPQKYTDGIKNSAIAICFSKPGVFRIKVLYKYSDDIKLKNAKNKLILEYMLNVKREINPEIDAIKYEVGSSQALTKIKV